MIQQHCVLTESGPANGGGRNELFEAVEASDYNSASPGIDAGQGGETMTERVARPRVRVLVVDDHAVVRAGFKRILDATDDLEGVRTGRRRLLGEDWRGHCCNQAAQCQTAQPTARPCANR